MSAQRFEQNGRVSTAAGLPQIGQGRSFAAPSKAEASGTEGGGARSFAARGALPFTAPFASTGFFNDDLNLLLVMIFKKSFIFT